MSMGGSTHSWEMWRPSRSTAASRTDTASSPNAAHTCKQTQHRRIFTHLIQLPTSSYAQPFNINLNMQQCNMSAINQQYPINLEMGIFYPFLKWQQSLRLLNGMSMHHHLCMEHHIPLQPQHILASTGCHTACPGRYLKDKDLDYAMGSDTSCSMVVDYACKYPHNCSCAAEVRKAMLTGNCSHGSIVTSWPQQVDRCQRHHCS